MQDNGYECELIAKPMKVKDYMPKFKTIELMVQIPIPPYTRFVCVKDIGYIDTHYGEKTLLSVVNFYNTKTTRYIIKELL